MRGTKFCTFMTAFAVLAGGAAPAATQTAQAVIVDNAGKRIGTANFRQGPSGVVFTVSVRGLTPGWHGIHFHAVGTCADHKTFTRSKGHITGGKARHGLLNGRGPHAGDLPNIWVGRDGAGRAQFYNDRIRVRGGRSALLDRDGTALVIHAKADDHRAQPIGGAGARVACGVVRAKK